eukprot:m.210704 g.210704  ORF g.210704 m.210704 type:complete len:50 (+) comp53962_c0_seq23:1053-1202(+)
MNRFLMSYSRLTRTVNTIFYGPLGLPIPFITPLTVVCGAPLTHQFVFSF